MSQDSLRIDASFSPPFGEERFASRREQALKNFVLRFGTYPHPGDEAKRLAEMYECGQAQIREAFRQGLLGAIQTTSRDINELLDETRTIRAMDLLRDPEIVEAIIVSIDRLSFYSVESLVEMLPHSFFLDPRVRERISQFFQTEVKHILDGDVGNLKSFGFGRFDRFGLYGWYFEIEAENQRILCRSLHDLQSRGATIGYAGFWESPPMREALRPLLEHCVNRRFGEAVRILRNDFGMEGADLRETAHQATSQALTSTLSVFEYGYDVRIAHALDVLKGIGLYDAYVGTGELRIEALIARTMIDRLERLGRAGVFTGPLSTQDGSSDRRRVVTERRTLALNKTAYFGYADAPEFKRLLDGFIGAATEEQVREAAAAACAALTCFCGGYMDSKESEQEVEAILAEYQVDIAKYPRWQEMVRGLLLYRTDRLDFYSVGWMARVFGLLSKDDPELKSALSSYLTDQVSCGKLVNDLALRTYAQVDAGWWDEAVKRGAASVFAHGNKLEDIQGFFDQEGIPADERRAYFEDAIPGFIGEKRIYLAYELACAFGISREAFIERWGQASWETEESIEEQLNAAEAIEGASLSYHGAQDLAEQDDPTAVQDRYMRAQLELLTEQISQVNDGECLYWLLGDHILPANQVVPCLVNAADQHFLAGHFDWAMRLVVEARAYADQQGTGSSGSDPAAEDIGEAWVRRVFQGIEKWSAADQAEQMVEALQCLRGVHWPALRDKAADSAEVAERMSRVLDDAFAGRDVLKIVNIADLSRTIFGEGWAQEGVRQRQAEALCLDLMRKTESESDPIFLQKEFRFSAEFIGRPSVQAAVESAALMHLRSGDVGVARQYAKEWLADRRWSQRPETIQAATDRCVQALLQKDIETVENLRRMVPLEDFFNTEPFLEAVRAFLTATIASDLEPDWVSDHPNEPWPDYPLSGQVKYCGYDFGAGLKQISPIATLPPELIQDAYRQALYRHLEAGTIYDDDIRKQAPDGQALLADPEAALAAERGVLLCLELASFDLHKLRPMMLRAEKYGWNPAESTIFQQAATKKLRRLFAEGAPLVDQGGRFSGNAMAIWSLAQAAQIPIESAREQAVAAMGHISDPFFALCVADLFRLETTGALQRCLERFSPVLRAELEAYAPRWLALSIPSKRPASAVVVDIWEQRELLRIKPWLIAYAIHPLAMQDDGFNANIGVLVERLAQDGTLLRKEDGQLFDRMVRSMGDQAATAMNKVYDEIVGGRLQRPLTANPHLLSFTTQFAFDGPVFKLYQAILDDQSLDDEARRERIAELRYKQPKRATGVRDPFEVLGLTPLATPTEIKKCYRELTAMYHPDKNPGHEEEFKRIVQAYKMLQGVRFASTDSSPPERVLAG